LRPDQTVGEALTELRANPPRGQIIYFYVVGASGRLVGVVSARALILSPLDRSVAELMLEGMISLPVEATMLQAGELFLQHRLLALPVVDGDGRLLGVVDVPFQPAEAESLNDAVRREALFQGIGVRVSEGARRSPWAAFRSRFPWLGCNMVGGLLAAFLCGAFNGVLDKVVALAFFIPVVLNLAESVSTQSVTLTLEAVHSWSLTWKVLLVRLWSELATGCLLGGASGLVIALVALMWLGQVRLALCLLGGVSGGVAVSAVLGVALPLLLRLLRLEPRVAAGPVALAAADVLTILLYLNLALVLLS
jgi:magnesium transporter